MASRGFGVAAFTLALVSLSGCLLEDDDDPINGTNVTNDRDGAGAASTAPDWTGGEQSAPAAGGSGGRTAPAATCDGVEPLPPATEEDLTIGPGCVRINDFEVNGSATLTLLPGTRVEFAPGGFLSVGRNGGSATLSAVGTPEAPITFTSSNANPRAGDWQCIHLDGDGSELDNVIVEFGGAACGATGADREGMIQVYGSPRGITNAVIQDSSTWASSSRAQPRSSRTTPFSATPWRRSASAPIA